MKIYRNILIRFCSNICALPVTLARLLQELMGNISLNLRLMANDQEEGLRCVGWTKVNK